MRITQTQKRKKFLTVQEKEDPANISREALDNAVLSRDNLAKSRPVSKGRRLKPRGRSLKDLNQLLGKLQVDPVFQSLSPTARLIVSEGVRVFFGGDGTGEVIQTKQAELLGFEIRTVQRAWKHAVDLEIVSSEKQHWANSGWRANNRYVLAERFQTTLQSIRPLTTYQSGRPSDISVVAEQNRILEQNKINTKPRTEHHFKEQLNETHQAGPNGLVFDFGSKTPSPSSEPRSSVLDHNRSQALATYHSGRAETPGDDGNWFLELSQRSQKDVLGLDKHDRLDTMQVLASLPDTEARNDWLTDQRVSRDFVYVVGEDEEDDEDDERGEGL